MTTARAKLIEKLEAAETSTLIDIVRALNRDTSAEAIVVCCEASNVLERRLADAEFANLMGELETDLMLA